MKTILLFLVAISTCLADTALTNVWFNGSYVETVSGTNSTPAANCVSNSVHGSAASTINVNDSSGEVYAFTCITNVNQITVCGVQFREQRQGVAPKNFQVEIRADNSFAPGTVLASSDIYYGTNVTTSAEWQAKIDLTNTVTLAANTRYWVGRKFDTYSGSSYYVHTTGSVGATGTSKVSADGSTWSDLSSRQFFHAIWAQ